MVPLLRFENNGFENCQTCVTRVSYILDGMFVIKHCVGEGIEVLINHYFLCLNVDG